MKTDGEKRRTRKLIELGGLVAKAGMGDYAKPFLLGFFIRCKRELIPTMTRQEMDLLFEEGFVALQKDSPKKKRIERPEEQPRPAIETPKKKEYFYDKVGELEPWMKF